MRRLKSFLRPFRIGFTGTRRGMTSEQSTFLGVVLPQILRAVPSVHGVHGDCVGADSEFHDMCMALSIPVIIRPTWERLGFRAFNASKSPGEMIVMEYEEDDPHCRNRRIVVDADIMFATPNTDAEVTRSGTWATIRLARAKKTPCFIIWPSGDVTLEQFSYLGRENLLGLGANTASLEQLWDDPEPVERFSWFMTDVELSREHG